MDGSPKQLFFFRKMGQGRHGSTGRKSASLSERTPEEVVFQPLLICTQLVPSLHIREKRVARPGSFQDDTRRDPVLHIIFASILRYNLKRLLRPCQSRYGKNFIFSFAAFILDSGFPSFTTPSFPPVWNLPLAPSLVFIFIFIFRTWSFHRLSKPCPGRQLHLGVLNVNKS